MAREAYRAERRKLAEMVGEEYTEQTRSVS
jgi:hypothetical protein